MSLQLPSPSVSFNSLSLFFSMFLSLGLRIAFFEAVTRLVAFNYLVEIFDTKGRMQFLRDKSGGMNEGNLQIAPI